MSQLTVPKEYAHLKTPEEIYWVHADRVWLWEQKGWAVNEIYGDKIGGFDVVLMVKKGREPRKKKEEGKK